MAAIVTSHGLPEFYSQEQKRSRFGIETSMQLITKDHWKRTSPHGYSTVLELQELHCFLLEKNNKPWKFYTTKNVAMDDQKKKLPQTHVHEIEHKMRNPTYFVAGFYKPGLSPTFLPSLINQLAAL